MTARFNSETFVSISVSPFLKKQALIQFRVPILFDVPKTSELFEWIVRRNSTLQPGAIKAIPTLSDDSLIHLFFTYEMLGDGVYFEEFNFGIALSTAASLDTQLRDLQIRFGGESAEIPAG